MTTKLKNRLLFSLCFLAVSTAYCDQTKQTDQVSKSKKIRVAVIDTGIHGSLMDKQFLCKEGHKDFTKTGIEDRHGHGSNVSGLIDQYAKNKIIGEATISQILSTKTDYCQVIIKFWDPTMKHEALDATVKAFEYAIQLKVDYINYSAGGTEYSAQEHKIIKKALDVGIKVVVAAGNESSDIEKKPYYPAKLDSRLIVVGNLDKTNKRTPTSNYGSSVDVWEVGDTRVSYGTDKIMSVLSGTSQAAAIHTGKLIRNSLKSSP